MANETVTIRGDGIAMDLLLWRRHGPQGVALVEAALDLNPGVARAGAFLPLGAQIALPPLPARTLAPATAVSLFD